MGAMNLGSTEWDHREMAMNDTVNGTRPTGSSPIRLAPNIIHADKLKQKQKGFQDPFSLSVPEIDDPAPQNEFEAMPPLKEEEEPQSPTTKPTATTKTSSSEMRKARQSTPEDLARIIGTYKIGKTLGVGSTGKVKLGIHLPTGRKRAVKIVLKNKEKGKEPGQLPSKELRLRREIALQTLLKHPNIVTLHETIETPDHFYLFSEHVDGGQLLDYIIANGRLREKMARNFFRQIISAVDYCHKNGVVHRDLKIENILISRDGLCKVIDFGLSNLFDPKSHLKTFCGSLYFAAPELLKGEYYTGPEVDIWSLGVILFVLVSGKVPFDDKSLPRLHQLIKEGNVVYPDHLTEDCQHLLSRMLVADPAARASLDEIINHPWVNKSMDSRVYNYVPHREPLDAIEEDVIDSLIKNMWFQFSRDEVNRVLVKALQNWSEVAEHPIIYFYYLCREKIKRDQIRNLRHETRKKRESQKYSPDSLPFSQISSKDKAPAVPVTSSPEQPAAQDNEKKMKRRNSLAAAKHRLSKFIMKRQESYSDSNEPQTLSTLQPDDHNSEKLRKEVKATRRASYHTVRRLSSIFRGQQSPLNGSDGTHERSVSGATSGRMAKTESYIDSPSATTRAPTPTPAALNAEDPMEEKLESAMASMKIKTVSIKGLLSILTTSSRPIAEIRQAIAASLRKHHIRHTERDGTVAFVCQHSPSILSLPINNLTKQDMDKSVISTSSPEMETHVDAAIEPQAFSAELMDSVVQFEVSIVKLPFALHGIQMRRITGNPWLYRQLYDKFQKDMSTCSFR